MAKVLFSTILISIAATIHAQDNAHNTLKYSIGDKFIDPDTKPIHGSYDKEGNYISTFGHKHHKKAKKVIDDIYFFPLPPNTTKIISSKYRLNTKDVFKTGPITWLGIDLTHANLICFDTSINMDELQNKFMPDWNDLLIREKDKFSFQTLQVVKDRSYRIN